MTRLMKIITNDVEKSRLELVNTSCRWNCNRGRNQKVVRKELTWRQFSLKTGRKLCSQKGAASTPFRGQPSPVLIKTSPLVGACWQDEMGAALHDILLQLELWCFLNQEM